MGPAPEFLTILREIVVPEEVDRHWSIFPPAAAENVVPMASMSRSTLSASYREAQFLC
jgi:hypothetical protein